VGVTKKDKPGKQDYRSAKTGRFVTESYAKKHPGTTVKEHNPLPSCITNVSTTVPAPPVRTKKKK